MVYGMVYDTMTDHAPARHMALCRITTLSGKVLQGVVSENAEIIRVIETFFNTGRTKDLGALRKIQVSDGRFSSFSDVPPYDLKDYGTTIALEELRFVSISDYNYTISNPKITILDNVAVVAFELVQTGMVVDNKAFTGEHIIINGRATFVLIMEDEWRIVHIHMSKA